LSKQPTWKDVKGSLGCDGLTCVTGRRRSQDYFDTRLMLHSSIHRTSYPSNHHRIDDGYENVAAEHWKLSLAQQTPFYSPVNACKVCSTIAGHQKVWAGDEGKESKRFRNNLVVALRMMRQGLVLPMTDEAESARL
jgi:hypothetical protein